MPVDNTAQSRSHSYVIAVARPDGAANAASSVKEPQTPITLNKIMQSNLGCKMGDSTTVSSLEMVPRHSNLVPCWWLSSIIPLQAHVRQAKSK